MRRTSRTFAWAGALACGLTAPLWAADGDANRAEKLEQQVQQLQARVAELEASDDQDWMTRRRAEQVKTLVRDVLSDAETRSTLLQEGATAGYDGGFFLKSADDKFYLELAGHLQVRYIWNNRNDSGGDDNLAGFQVRRAKFKGEGHIGTPRFTYDFSLAGDRDAPGSTVFEDYTFSYELADGLSVTAGRAKLPFAIQNLTSSSRQLAVERSSVHESFNVDRSEGAMISYETGQFRVTGAVSDGAGGDFSDFDTNAADVAFTGRAEAKLAGDWGQLKDPATAWSGEPTGAFVGGALHYEIGETGENTVNGDFLRWTVDGTFESNNFGVLVAGYGNHTDNDSGMDFDDFGFLAEGGYFIVPDKFQPFVRYELIIADDSRPSVAADTIEEETSIVTAGFNWYQQKHDAKFTMDVVYGLDPLAGLVNTSTGLGLRPDAPGEDGQLALRAQYQIKW